MEWDVCIRFSAAGLVDTPLDILSDEMLVFGLSCITDSLFITYIVQIQG